MTRLTAWLQRIWRGAIQSSAVLGALRRVTGSSFLWRAVTAVVFGIDRAWTRIMRLVAGEGAPEQDVQTLARLHALVETSPLIVKIQEWRDSVEVGWRESRAFAVLAAPFLQLEMVVRVRTLGVLVIVATLTYIGASIIVGAPAVGVSWAARWAMLGAGGVLIGVPSPFARAWNGRHPGANSTRMESSDER